MFVIGADLSGPANPQATAIAILRASGSTLRFERLINGVSDDLLYDTVRDLLGEGNACIGLDAPLSYNLTGGDRPGDKDLRRQTVAAGLNPGSVMAPTASRMSYLTLRGLAVARVLRLIEGESDLRIVEVHPTAALALGGAPIDAVRTFKKEGKSRKMLVDWLRKQGVEGIREEVVHSDHSLAASATAWATWLWFQGRSHWRQPAEPPHHPFDFSC